MIDRIHKRAHTLLIRVWALFVVAVNGLVSWLFDDRNTIGILGLPKGVPGIHVHLVSAGGE